MSADRARIAILDYGMGNLRSVEKALARVGASVEITDDHDRVRSADGVLLPGVGAFPEAMAAVRGRGLDDLVRERARAGVPVLGICLGMQLLFESSTELAGAAGIGVLQGSVDTLAVNGLKLPQIGWNPVTWRRSSRLARRLPNPCAFYHVHSFGAAGVRPADILGTAAYGSEFVSAVEHENVYGVQFHPEKSGEHGLRLLAGFVAGCRA